MPRRHSIEPFAVPALAALFAVAWTLFAGKDIGWDLFNHHLYLPFALLSGRIETDLFAAGPQSYQNPIGYVPFYLLARSGLPSWLVGVVLAAACTGPSAWALHSICRSAMGDAPELRRWRVLGVALAVVAPIFLYVVGTSSNDPLCTALVLAALAVALQAQAGIGWAIAGGLMLGLAVAIKPTAAIFALPTLAVAVSRAWGRQWRVSALAAYLAAAGLGFAVAGGMWGWWLWTHFGNPTFPLFNHLFQSPYAPTGVTVAVRFLPRDGLDWLLRPWVMAQVKPFAMVEAVMPDPRPLLAALAVPAAAVAATLRRGPGIWARASTWLRADVQLVLVLAVSYGMWMASSGNARYAVAWFLLTGPALARAVMVCWAASWSALALAVVAALQLFTFVGSGDLRTLAGAWDSRPYMPVDVPRQLVDEPYLHLSIGVQSHAGLAPYLHPDGAFINITGQMSLPVTGPLGDRLHEQLARWKGRTRVLFAPSVPPNSPKFATLVAAENFSLTHRLGLRIDTEHCDRIRMIPPSPGSATGGPLLLSCPVVEQRRQDAGLDQDLAEARRVFDALETSCPRIFGPRPMASDYGPQLIWRRYMNSDVRVDVSKTDGVIVSHFRALNPVALGSAQAVIDSGGKNACEAWNRLSIQ